jgi:hypothetical protein
MRGPSTSHRAADGKAVPNDLELAGATMEMRDAVVMPLPVYERGEEEGGRVGSEITLVGQEIVQVRREGTGRQEEVAVPPPAYHAGAGGEQRGDVGEMGKRMNAERCA